MSTSKSIAIKLSKVAEKAVKQGHPWVFENSIIKGNEQEHEDGSLCVIFDSWTNKPFAFGLWDANSTIRIKIVYVGEKFTFGKDFLKVQLQKAKDKRKSLYKFVTGFRAVNGENDNFPGIILDIYSKVAVLKIYSKAWFPHIPILTEAITEVLRSETIVLRFSRNISHDKHNSYEEGMMLGKPLEDEKILFDEYGVSFYAYPISGHKTGFFLDQRQNRYWIQQHAKDKTILDVFSYVGGFGIHGLKGGAKYLTSLDISQQAMDVAKLNLEVNHLSLKKWNPIVGDAFKVIEELIKNKKTFDIVILDPPSFAKQQSEVSGALKQYERLAKLGAKLTSSGGFLVLGSCSSRVTLEDFRLAHENAFEAENVKWHLEKINLHDVDHPVSYEEGAYLKTLIYKIYKKSPSKKR